MVAKSLLWMLLLVLVLAPITLASSISIEVIESQAEVEAGGNAEFTLKITNDGLERDVFSIEADEFNVYPFSDFAQRIEAKPFQVKLDAGESAIVKVIIRTREVVTPNKYYDSKMMVSSVIHPENKEEIQLKTYIASAKNIISIEPQIPRLITPGKEITIPLKIKNRSRLNIENIEITIVIDAPKTAERIFVNLKPQEEQELSINFSLDPAVSPGEEKLTIAAYQGEQLRGSFVTEITVLPKDRVEEDRDVKRGFLSSTTIITRENKGNAASDQKIEADYNIIQRMFSSMTPKPETEKGKVMWQFVLRPGERKSIEIKTNYRPALYGLIIVVIFTVILLFAIERSVVIKKRIFHGKEMVNGIAEYKIFLLLRNGKKYTLTDVKVMDLVPHIVELTSDFGSLRPDRIQQSERATRLLWNVIKLEPGEERVFSYKIRRKRNIVGDIVLPASIIQYVDNKDKFTQEQSMRVVLE